MTDQPINREHRARSRTETFEITISGLLTKRSDLYGETLRLRARLSDAEADIAALDRVLAALDYAGPLDAVSPRRSAEMPCGRGESMRVVLDVLRRAPASLTAREITEESMAALGQDRNNPTVALNYARRTSKCLQRLRSRGDAERVVDGIGVSRWRLVGA